MKISSYMNNMNPIIEKNDAKVQKENKQANEKHTMEQSVKLSISNDGSILKKYIDYFLDDFFVANNNTDNYNSTDNKE